MLRILIIDGQGGGIGRQLVEAVKSRFPAVTVIAVGTNTTATAAMLKAGADAAATGENAVKVNCRKADVILGPVGIVIADALWGEITPAMAAAVGGSDAQKILLPINLCNNYIAGVPNLSVSALTDDCLARIASLAD